eukprot:jgi/Mesvir1/16073/Mv08367-RA.1
MDAMPDRRLAAFVTDALPDRLLEALWLAVLWVLALARTFHRRWTALRRVDPPNILVTRAILYDASGDADVTREFVRRVDEGVLDCDVREFRDQVDVSWFERPGERVFLGVEYIVPGRAHSGKSYAIVYDLNETGRRVKFPPTAPTEDQRLAVSMSKRRVLSASFGSDTERLVTDDAIALAGPMRDLYVGDGMPPPVDGAIHWIARHAPSDAKGGGAGPRAIGAGDRLRIFYATGETGTYDLSCPGVIDGPIPSNRAASVPPTRAAVEGE